MAPSFYSAEQKRITEIIKEPLLLLILENLPHLQATDAERQDVWEIVATKLNTLSYKANVSSREREPNDEIPILNGGFIKTIYEGLIKKFIDRHVLDYRNGPNPIIGVMLPKRETFESRTDMLLCELFYLKNYDIEILSTLSKEKLEQSFRKKQEEEGVPREVTSSQSVTSIQLHIEKQKQLENKLAILEEELRKKEYQIEKLTSDNKALLELNHELVIQRN